MRPTPGGLVVITQLDPMTVLFTLPEDDLPRVQVELSQGPLVVDAYSRDGTLKLATGSLTFIDNQINQTTATIRLRASFPNPKSLLWPNEFVKARLLLSTEKNAIVVPAAAVQRGPTGTFVYVVADDMTATTSPIELASLQGDIAIITKGVTPGQQVVVDGQNQLKPGSKVAPRAADKPNGAGASSSASPSSSSSPAPSGSAARRANP